MRRDEPPRTLTNLSEPCETYKISANISTPQRSSAILSEPLANLSEPQRKSTKVSKPQQTLENLSGPATSANVSERYRTLKKFESSLLDILVQIRSHLNLLEPLRTFCNLGEAHSAQQNLTEPDRTRQHFTELCRFFVNL